MKRTVLLTLLFLVLGAGAVYVLFFRTDNKASTVSWDMEFGVSNTNQIHKIFIADRTGKTATLERMDDHWMYNGKYVARPTAMETLLETLQKQVVWYIPTKASEENMVKDLASVGIKVELYDKEDKNIKTFIVGGVTNDERGTFMIMENSDQPYVVHVPSFIGQLRVRYLLEEDDWRDRTVYREKPEQIQSISVDYPQMKSKSFRLEKTGEAEYEIFPFYTTTQIINKPIRKGTPEAYLLQFEQLGAEGLETNHPKRDSITQLVPFAIVSITRENGEQKNARFWPVSIRTRPDNQQKFVTRYFAEVDEHDFFLVQDNVFGPIFRGYSYFFEQKKIY